MAIVSKEQKGVIGAEGADIAHLDLLNQEKVRALKMGSYSASTFSKCEAIPIAGLILDTCDRTLWSERGIANVELDAAW